MYQIWTAQLIQPLLVPPLGSNYKMCFRGATMKKNKILGGAGMQNLMKILLT